MARRRRKSSRDVIVRVSTGKKRGGWRGRKRKTSRDVYRRTSLLCRQCGRSNFLTTGGLNDHIRKRHVRKSVKAAYGPKITVHSEKSLNRSARRKYKKRGNRKGAYWRR